MKRSQRNHRIIPSRRQRNSQGTEFQGSEDIEEENDDNGGKDSSSTDERSTEVRQHMRKRRPGIRPSQPSSSASNPEGGSIENDLEATRENRGICPGLFGIQKCLPGVGVVLEVIQRHGNASGCNNKNSRSTRLSKLVEYLRNLEEKNDEVCEDATVCCAVVCFPISDSYSMDLEFGLYKARVLNWQLKECLNWLRYDGRNKVWI
ncbi:hypothetical protein GH714_040337 [Hevea brasiliensis]|uniref:Uncharacterized protein n=1 Tax=Hevea brasiliensis TaxID=3981 RepID=A0A6A6K908_HEVBR|nr:hypothetical protein GH714_040337 [Hevea brasiliensis]